MAAPIIANGWTIFAHPLFLDQIDGLIEEVEEHERRDPGNYRKKNCSKRLAAIVKLVTEVIPANPANPVFRQGGSLGEDRKHWFRAKFFQQYRLFFRFDSRAKVIVLAWVNDDKTLRAYGSRTDAYAVFKGMLDGGNPPDDFAALLKAARASGERFDGFMKASSQD